MAQVEELTAELSRERAERLRLENFLRDKSSQEASTTSSLLGSPTKASLSRELLHDASKFDSTGCESSGDEAPCFGESRNSAKLVDTDGEKVSPTSRRRRVWGSDEELDPGSNIAKMLSGSSVTTLWKADSESTLGGPNGCASSDANTSHIPDHFTDCGDTDLESKVSLPFDTSTVDSIASIDSRLKMLTGMLTDQNEELKKRLDMIGTVVPGLHAIQHSLKLPPMPVSSDATHLDLELEEADFPGASAAAAAMTKARGRAADTGSETSEVRLASLQRLRVASTDPNLPPEQLRQIIDDALTPPDTARQILSDADSVEYVGSRASQRSDADRKQRAVSPPPAPPRVAVAPLKFSGMQLRGRLRALKLMAMLQLRSLRLDSRHSIAKAGV